MNRVNHGKITVRGGCRRALGHTLCAGLALAAGAAAAQSHAGAPKPPQVKINETPPEIVQAWQGGYWRVDRGSVGFTGLTRQDYYYRKIKAPPNPPPYTPDFAETYERVRAAARDRTNGLDYPGRCLPYGMPTTMGGPIFEFVFSPSAVYLIFEDQGGTRRVWLDGRSRPADVEPEFNGYAVGHWEGETLVVETTNVRVDTVLDIGAPHSDALRVVERISPTGPNKIRNEVTVTDPNALTKPWTHTWSYTREPTGIIEDHVCRLR